MPSETAKRRHLRRAEVLEILANQGVPIPAHWPVKGSKEAELFGLVVTRFGPVPCGNFAECKTWIWLRKDCVRDHKIALRLVDADKRPDYDRPWNQWYLCRSCNAQKTYRRGLGPIYGSDAMRNAKQRRLEKRRQHQLGEIPACPKPSRIPPRAWPKVSRKRVSDATPQSRPFPKRPLPSRPFPKRPPNPAGPDRKPG